MCILIGSSCLIIGFFTGMLYACLIIKEIVKNNKDQSDEKGNS